MHQTIVGDGGASVDFALDVRRRFGCLKARRMQSGARGNGRTRGRVSGILIDRVEARRMHPNPPRPRGAPLLAHAQQRRPAGMVGVDGVMGVEDHEGLRAVVLDGRPPIDTGRTSLLLLVVVVGGTAVVAHGLDDGLTEGVAVLPGIGDAGGGGRRRGRWQQGRAVVRDRPVAPLPVRPRLRRLRDCGSGTPFPSRSSSRPPVLRG